MLAPCRLSHAQYTWDLTAAGMTGTEDERAPVLFGAGRRNESARP